MTDSVDDIVEKLCNGDIIQAGGKSYSLDDVKERMKESGEDMYDAAYTLAEEINSNGQG